MYEKVLFVPAVPIVGPEIVPATVGTVQAETASMVISSIYKSYLSKSLNTLKPMY